MSSVHEQGMIVNNPVYENCVSFGTVPSHATHTAAHPYEKGRTQRVLVGEWIHKGLSIE